MRVLSSCPLGVQNVVSDSCDFIIAGTCWNNMTFVARSAVGHRKLDESLLYQTHKR